MASWCNSIIALSLCMKLFSETMEFASQCRNPATKEGDVSQDGYLLDIVGRSVNTHCNFKYNEALYYACKVKISLR